MLGFSSVTLLGSVVRVESRQTSGGTLIATVTVAGDVPGRDPGRVIPFYQQVQLIGKSAELYANVPVGSVVFAQGTLRQDRWQDKNDANRTQSAVRVTANVFGVVEGSFEMVSDARDQLRLAAGRNDVVLTGNLTRDADHRMTSNGNPLTRLSVAVNQTQPNREPYVSYFDVSAWGDLALRTAGLRKGSGVVVWCTVQNQTWDDRLTGEKRYGTGFDAREVMSVGLLPGDGAVSAAGSSSVAVERASAPVVAGGLRTRPAVVLEVNAVVDDYPVDEVDWAAEVQEMDAAAARPAPQQPAARPIPQQPAARPIPQPAARPQQPAPQPAVRPAPQPAVRPAPQQPTARPQQPAPQPAARPQQPAARPQTNRVSNVVPAPQRTSPIPNLNDIPADFPESDELPF
jgi:single stranded DNA-binding protein